MKSVILAGGLGTRISEETHLKPKPMIEIGGKPVIWHIMKMYSFHGINDFIICCGYKGYVIKEYFANYFLHMSDITFNISENTMEVHKKDAEPWNITLIDTGENTLTGGRLKRVYEYLKDDSAFCFTYGDGVSDIDISQSIKFHDSHGKLATVSAITPPGRYGSLDLNGDQVKGFREKPKGDGAVINGGFFVLSPEVINLIEGYLDLPEIILHDTNYKDQLQRYLQNRFKEYPKYEIIEWLVGPEDLTNDTFVNHYYQVYVKKHKFPEEGNEHRRPQEQVALGLLHQGGEHKYLWGEAEMITTLKDLGFSSVQTWPYGVSGRADFNGIEKPDIIRSAHSGVVEATKW